VAKRILIVDDSAFIRMALRDILTENGYEVAGEAENGAQGVMKFKELLPDLVTMDVLMADKTGLEALKEIMNADRNAKVLMVTAMGKQNMVIEAVQAGAKGFLIKPFEPKAVIAEINRILKV
jgi:two-component system chemotaxis response regulator CheY